MNRKAFSKLTHSDNTRTVLIGSSVVVGSLYIGFLTIPLFASQASTLGQFFSVVGVALAIACSALLSGCLLGFLFGIPRTLQQEGLQTDQQNKTDQQQETKYVANTNLEQISDWLTKILVGVGLTQISSLPEALSGYADFISIGLGNFPSSRAYSVALLIFFLIDGFLISYLGTRLYLAGALRQADAVNRLSRVEEKLDIIDIDAKAWSTVQRLLNPDQGSKPYSQDEINAIIAPATSEMKAQIFWTAAEVRSNNWREIENKPKMEQTIPVFKALIASDTHNVYHQNHGQLGYALKDSRPPKWEEALSELTVAINLRGSLDDKDWFVYYEFARAICRINLDEAFKNNKQSDPKIKQEILNDLNIVFNFPEVKENALADPDIKLWLELNS